MTKIGLSGMNEDQRSLLTSVYGGILQDFKIEVRVNDQGPMYSQVHGLSTVA